MHNSNSINNYNNKATVHTTASPTTSFLFIFIFGSAQPHHYETISMFSFYIYQSKSRYLSLKKKNNNNNNNNSLFCCAYLRVKTIKQHPRYKITPLSQNSPHGGINFLH